MPANVTEADYQAYRRRVKQPARAAISLGDESKPEDKAVTLLKAIIAAKLPGVWYREFTFHQERNWRIDVACPEMKVGVEVSGQVHRIKDKFARDREKRNALIFAGWRVLEVTPAQVDSGEALELVRALLHSVHAD